MPSGGSRVWVVNHYADAPDRPNGTRHHDLARQLAARRQDPESLADSLLELADAGPDARARMGEAGRDNVVRARNVEPLGRVPAAMVPCDSGVG